MDRKVELDPNKVYSTLVAMFEAVGKSNDEAKRLARDFWKKIYIDAVMLMAEMRGEMDKSKLREVADKGIMAELLIEALKYVPAEELNDYVATVAGNYTKVLWDEMEKHLNEEEKVRVREVWKDFGESEGLLVKKDING
jgi:hypothetical protein